MTAITRILTTRKSTVAAIATAGAAACALSLVPHTAHAAEATHAPAKATAHTAAAKASNDKASGDSKSTTGKTSKTGKASKTTPAAKIANIAKDPGNHYPNTLDGWIHQSLDIMKIKHIPGSYEGLHRNIIRESSGNPNAVNNWDINAQNGIPSKGLLQVIQPTFDTYHVKGTKNVLTDPVANIVAAANYAADRYGSMDNVNSAY